MAVFKDLTKQKFGKLLVLGVSRQVQSGKRTRYYWNCKCECGNEKEIRTDGLTSGSVQSCGCLKKEQDKINLTKFHRHKMSNTKLYHTWQKMKDRCLNPNVPCYARYGGRGITVCQEWLTVDAFLEWAKANGYSEGLQLDRIDNNGNYEPANCRWVTVKENCRNRRSNIVVDYYGKPVTLVELSEITGISYSCLNARYHRGNRGENLTRPVAKIHMSTPC